VFQCGRPRCTERQYALVVDAAVEDHSVAVFAFKFGGIHAGAGVLDGIENVDAAVEQARDQRLDGAVRVEEHAQAMAVHEVAPSDGVAP